MSLNGDLSLIEENALLFWTLSVLQYWCNSRFDGLAPIGERNPDLPVNTVLFVTTANLSKLKDDTSG